MPPRLLAAACLLAACVEAPAPSDLTSSDVPVAAAPDTPTVLGPGDGERLRFGDGREAVLKVTAEGVGAERLLLGTESLPPGTAIPVHAHDGYEEVLFVHQGSPLLSVGDSVVQAAPGTTVYVPAGAWHGVAAGDTEASTVLFLFPETDIADFFRTVGWAEGEPPPRLGDEDWAQTMARHRMRSRPE